MEQHKIYQQAITLKGVMCFVLPTVLMMLIQQSYAMIDGIFIANEVGDTALSSITLISPYLNFFTAIASMLASGGSAVVMKKMGEKKEQTAREDFSALLVLSVLIGAVLTVLVLLFAKELTAVFQAEAIVSSYCLKYLSAYGFFIIPSLLFSSLQIYTIAVGNAKRAMFAGLFGGVFNILCDYIFIVVFHMEMSGAAIASGFGLLIPCVILAYPLLQKRNALHFTIPVFRKATVIKTFTNGCSEFTSNLVSGIVMLIFNAQMLKLAGSNGVAASTVTFYVFGLMSAFYMGYMFGISPLLSYFYGEGSSEKLRRLKQISLRFIAVAALITTLLSVFASAPLVSIFTDPSGSAYTLALKGNRIFSFALLFVGFNTFSGMFFTALSNGKVSAVIAFSRSFVFLVIMIIVLPIVFGINGLWLAVPLSELTALGLSFYLLKKYQAVYAY